MPARSWILAGAALLTLAAPASAATTFEVQIGSPVGTPNCGGANSGVSTTPVARDLTCAPVGAGSLLAGEAAALFGHVGASSDFASPEFYFGTAFAIIANSRFLDDVTFTSLDPLATSTTIAANLAFSGTLARGAGGGAYVDARWLLFGGAVSDFIFISTNDPVNTSFTTLDGSLSQGSSNALLRGRTFTVPLNQPISIGLRLETFAGGPGGGSSARAEFSNSFEVPFGMDAFVLPEGVTANSGTWLVNNRRVRLDAAVPEPATWAIMVLGFGMIGGAMRRGRRQSLAFI